MEKHIPKKKGKIRQGQLLVNAEVKNVLRNKHRAWKKYIRNKNLTNWQGFTEARNIANRTINRKSQILN